MRSKLLITAAMVIVGATVFARGKDPVTLVWKPKVGSVLNAKLKITGTVNGNDLAITGDETETVKAINPDQSVVVEDKLTNQEIMFGGNPVPAGDDIVSTITEGPDGHVLDRKSNSATDSPRSNNLQQFVFPSHPVNVGDIWKFMGKGDKSKDTADYEIDYTFKGVESMHGMACNRIDITMKDSGDTPITGTSTVWLNPDTGDLVKIQGKVKNVPGPGGTADVDFVQEAK